MNLAQIAMASSAWGAVVAIIWIVTFFLGAMIYDRSLEKNGVLYSALSDSEKNSIATKFSSVVQPGILLVVCVFIFAVAFFIQAVSV